MAAYCGRKTQSVVQQLQLFSPASSYDKRSVTARKNLQSLCWTKGDGSDLTYFLKINQLTGRRVYHLLPNRDLFTVTVMLSLAQPPALRDSCRLHAGSYHIVVRRHRVRIHKLRRRLRSLRCLRSLRLLLPKLEAGKEKGEKLNVKKSGKPGHLGLSRSTKLLIGLLQTLQVATHHRVFVVITCKEAFNVLSIRHHLRSLIEETNALCPRCRNPPISFYLHILSASHRQLAHSLYFL